VPSSRCDPGGFWRPDHRVAVSNQKDGRCGASQNGTSLRRMSVAIACCLQSQFFSKFPRKRPQKNSYLHGGQISLLSPENAEWMHVLTVFLLVWRYLIVPKSSKRWKHWRTGNEKPTAAVKLIVWIINSFIRKTRLTCSALFLVFASDCKLWWSVVCFLQAGNGNSNGNGNVEMKWKIKTCS